MGGFEGARTGVLGLGFRVYRGFGFEVHSKCSWAAPQTWLISTFSGCQ